MKYTWMCEISARHLSVAETETAWHFVVDQTVVPGNVSFSGDLQVFIKPCPSPVQKAISFLEGAYSRENSTVVDQAELISALIASGPYVVSLEIAVDGESRCSISDCVAISVHALDKSEAAEIATAVDDLGIPIEIECIDLLSDEESQVSGVQGRPKAKRTLYRFLSPGRLRGVALHEPGSRYRWRTRLRANSPRWIAMRIPKGPKDCGDHDWYNSDDVVDLCYHCSVGMRSHKSVAD